MKLVELIRCLSSLIIFRFWFEISSIRFVGLLRIRGLAKARRTHWNFRELNTIQNMCGNLWDKFEDKLKPLTMENAFFQDFSPRINL